ncbi:hypothetical protein NLI96_g11961 [Meripilus lineatus]|uniref:Uncharacterized protein n=1 Tax=Meripilus lineatus TaxID=2056292 RepID=A0AAD5UVR2_9APHY|nr:hypothetical protein NLI96_g11961 [Physisporinus lineatus]
MPQSKYRQRPDVSHPSLNHRANCQSPLPPSRPSSELLSPAARWESQAPPEVTPADPSQNWVAWYLQWQLAETNKTRAKVLNHPFRVQRHSTLLPSNESFLLHHKQPLDPLPLPPFRPPPVPPPGWFGPGVELDTSEWRARAVNRHQKLNFIPKGLFPGKTVARRRNQGNPAN